MRKSSWQFIVSIFSLASLMLACSSFSIPGVGGGDNAILRDDFSNSLTGTWGTGTDADSSVEYANGGLQFIVYSERYITWSNPDSETYENVHVEVTAKNDSTDRLAVYGIICDEQVTQSFYYIGVASDGYYTISKSAVAQDDVSLTSGTSTLVPADSTPFTIGADCGNGTITMYINGQQVASVQDSTYTNGKVGLFAGSNDTPNSVNVTFDDFVVTAL
ncbi:MAG: hypothetical protein HZB19_22030 [Chloroflexi bacterium]|nr:hypothetical protein [Chloroflexota bacterium]